MSNPPRKTKTAPLIAVVSPDWQGIVNALLRAGYPKQQIAYAANCSRETVYTLLNGGSPSWHTGEALVKLHRKVAMGEPVSVHP